MTRWIRRRRRRRRRQGRGLGQWAAIYAVALTRAGWVLIRSNDDALQTKTNEVTDALRRTTTLMQSELERSVLSVQMLGG